ncbi:hypothetical protein [Cohnella cholangitidis]|uniref:Uncharacterized protein n=1 Tax=Cohnella cholangitidis TaxID=2598458 RepID=A0A7G5C5A0_9BACL|nr:hypothetical protein [Cohnella cholangitidis]QMV44384.1 hypothetical protein FPL14_26870 [Cohnella cholangitidis]
MSQAQGMRLEQLKKQGEGERKLLVDIIWPVRKSFHGITLEKEIVTLSGVKAYIDAFDDSFRFGFEAEGFVPHAENITRPRFDFEKQKVRSMPATFIKYIPFTFDEMDKKPDMCRRTLYELYGRYGANAKGATYHSLSLYEREVIRYAIYLCRPIRMADIRDCLQKNQDTCRIIIRQLIEKRFMRPRYDGLKRNHEYVLEEDAYKILY